MIYEVRTYTLSPGKVAEFEERFAKRLPTREKHSKLGGFWHTDLGPLNQVIHVWPFEDLQQRQNVRDAMAADTELQQLGNKLGWSAKRRCSPRFEATFNRQKYTRHIHAVPATPPDPRQLS